MLTKSATLMPAADLPPSEARGRYQLGLLTSEESRYTPEKKKARFGVCGAPPTGRRYTPEKKKQDLACAEHPPTGRRYTPEKKKQDLACAEHPPTGRRYTPEKEKARFGMCGATPNKFKKLSSLQTSRGMIHLYCAFCSE